MLRATHNSLRNTLKYQHLTYPLRFSSNQSFLSGANREYAEEMHRIWLKDPSQVHSSWDVYFRTGSFAMPPSPPQQNYQMQYQVVSQIPQTIHGERNLANAVSDLIRAFQVRGHLMAKLDPLNIQKHGIDKNLVRPYEFDPTRYGITEADLDTFVDISSSEKLGFQSQQRGKIKVRDLIKRLHETYTSTIGIEYMHISNIEQCNFIREKFETIKPYTPIASDKVRCLDRLTWADHFEQFLAQKFPTAKRFGLEGAESLIPGMKAVIDTSAQLGVESIIMGMPHRGRLNVLASVVRKPLETIFSEFTGGGAGEEVEGSGDVKYHLGLSFDRQVYGGKSIHLTLVANPSHLEAVNPLVTGKARAKQYFNNNSSDKCMAFLLHGDAAFSGQGVVYETMGLSSLDEYSVGGTVHIVVNNQIGFTTDPTESRSFLYCTDIAKAFGAPVFHVNGDDVEAVDRVCQIAAEWRQKFKKDCVIDLVCYRKYGHNEIDEPKFTQPFMYDNIKKKESPLQIYTKKLVTEGSIKELDAKDMSLRINRTIAKKFELAKNYKDTGLDWGQQNWSPEAIKKLNDTRISNEDFKELSKYVFESPKDYKLHSRLSTVLKKRKERLQAGEGLDWACGELLAFGSLLKDGYHVRVSGQDVERGTFSHRHAVLHDQKDKTKPPYVPLHNITKKFPSGNNGFTISNSSLSEFAVLGFELGYSLENPSQLVIWEAQFGDFSNGAQIIIDQFLASGETKWLRQTGLVLLLPHGYEGQGPEHSSARIERFLQLSDEDENVFYDSKDDQVKEHNIQVVNCTTPAQYFHVLRRQLARSYRKPLIIATPKSLLRDPRAISSMKDFTGKDARFAEIIPDTSVSGDLESVVRVVFSVGKVFYDLKTARDNEENNKTSKERVALIRVEQISPFPFQQVLDELKQYPNLKSIVWCQEEPKNAGCWFYAKPRLETVLSYGKLNNISIAYAGRAPSASPATGFLAKHKSEQAELLESALTL